MILFLLLESLGRNMLQIYCMWFLWPWLGGGLLAIILQARFPPAAKPLARQF